MTERRTKRDRRAAPGGYYFIHIFTIIVFNIVASCDTPCGHARPVVNNITHQLYVFDDTFLLLHKYCDNK